MQRGIYIYGYNNTFRKMKLNWHPEDSYTESQLLKPSFTDSYPSFWMLYYERHVFLQVVIGEHDIEQHDNFEQIGTVRRVVIEPGFSML